MRAHYDIIQGTDNWLKFRHGKIGGTRSKGLFIESDTLLFELVSERTEDYVTEEGYLSDAMQRGNDLEPVALDRLSDYTGIDFITAGWLESDIPNVGISPDGISKDETEMVEIKCLGGKKHIEVCVNDVIPKDYAPQLVHAFTVNNKLETLYFCAFRPESKVKPLFVKELKRDTSLDIGLTHKIKVSEDRGKGMKEYVATVPLMKTVDEWVKIARKKAVEINEQIDKTIESLSF